MKGRKGLAFIGIVSIVFVASMARGASSGEPFLPNSVLTLQDVVAVALQHHPDIKSREGTLLAGLSRARAGSADYYPQIAFDSSYSRGNYLNFVGPAFQIVTSVFLTYTSNFTVSWTLEDWGRRFAVVGEGNAVTEMAKSQLRDVRNKVIFEASEAYFKVLQAQTLTEVNRKLQEASQKRMDQAAAFVRTGEKPKLEFLNAQTAYLSDHFNYLKSQEDLENAIAHLNRAMGVLTPPPYTVKEDLSTPPFQIDLASAKAAAFQMNPLILWNKWNVASKQAVINQRKADRYPVVAANALYGWVDSKFPPGTQSWVLGGTLHWPLFDGNKLTHQINEAVGNLMEAQGQEDSVRLQVGEEVDKNFRSYISAKNRLSVAQQEVAQAEEASRLADARYKNGLATFLEVADAQAKLSQAKAHDVAAITDLRVSESALKRSMGLGEP